MRRRGFTLIEVLVALLILTFLLLTSLTVFTERTRRLRDANDMVLAYQALENEAEARKHVPFVFLKPTNSTPFLSDISIFPDLTNAKGTVKIEQVNPYARLLTMKVEWRKGRKSASLAIYRTDTGGNNLW